LVGLGFALLLSAGIQARAESEIGQHLSALELTTESADPSSRRRMGRAVIVSYAKWFTPSQGADELQKLSDDDIGLLFRAANYAFESTEDRKYLGDMSRDLSAMSDRHIAYRANYLNMDRAFFEDRDFSKAAALERQSPDPDNPIVPRFICDSRVPQTSRYLEIQDGGRSVVCRSAALNMKSQIVVVASPHCHFCRHAIPAIESDPVLRRAFGGRTIWLVPQADTGFSDVAHWNRSYPNEKMVAVLRQREWPMIVSWNTPTFYFLSDGKIVATVAGWPLPSGNEKALIVALRRIGAIR
jgi:hypothetical protein